MSHARSTEGEALVTTQEIPNAYGKFTQVLVKGEPVGVYKAVKGGFVPIGMRKPRKTEKEAQAAVIQCRIRNLLREASPLMEALGEVCE